MINMTHKTMLISIGIVTQSHRHNRMRSTIILLIKYPGVGLADDWVIQEGVTSVVLDPDVVDVASTSLALIKAPVGHLG